MSRTGWNCWSTPTGTILRKLRRLLLRTFRTDSWPPRLLFVATQRPQPSKPSGYGTFVPKKFHKNRGSCRCAVLRNWSRCIENSTDPEIKRGVVKDPKAGEPDRI